MLVLQILLSSSIFICSSCSAGDHFRLLMSSEKQQQQQQKKKQAVFDTSKSSTWWEIVDLPFNKFGLDIHQFSSSLQNCHLCSNKDCAFVVSAVTSCTMG